MKLSNLKYSHETDDFIYATVTVTTGFLWWKKSWTETIYRSAPNGEYWAFMSTGEWTPGHQAEVLEYDVRTEQQQKQRLARAKEGFAL